MSGPATRKAMRCVCKARSIVSNAMSGVRHAMVAA